MQYISIALIINVSPTGITTTSTEISKSGADICSELVPNYIAALPSDPSNANQGQNIVDCNEAYNTGYSIYEGSDGRIRVVAEGEIESPIEVSR